ncbi:TPA: DUF1275 domain-containing protein, partial [Burkholderia multivorans]|nr:DUF1275 domain-containing protein [Burkholderia multivorans]
IELGKLLYWNLGTTHRDLVRADRQKLLLLGSLLLSFLVGGLAGAVGFRHVGFMSSVPLAIVLVTLAVVPIFDDMLARRRWPKR